MTVIKNLKNLLCNWFHLKSEAEDNYYTRFSENVTYNGVFKVTEVINQTITLSVTGSLAQSDYATLIITCNISPAITGQTVMIKGDYVDKTVTTTSNGVVESNSIKVDNNTSVYVEVEGIKVGDVYYGGGSKVYTFTRNEWEN